jgi:prepilin-type N-terminal cleavage/methylation domain-containing protein
MIKIKTNQAFSLVEVIVALGVFAILAAGIFNVVTSSYRNFYGTGDKQAIAEFAKEGIEATRAIRDNFWQDIETVSDTGDQGIVKAASGYWTFSGSSDTSGALTRTVAVTDIERDANGEIVDSGGTVDPNTKKVTVTVSGSGIDDYVLTTYLANWDYKTWEQSDWSGVGDREFWSDMTMASSSYSNISTSTLGELVLSQPAAQGAILGDWTSFASSTMYALPSYSHVYDMVPSPDGNVLYITGSTSVDLQAYDIENARSGIFGQLWSTSMTNSFYSMEIDSSGQYIYLGSASTTAGYMDTLIEVRSAIDGSLIDSEDTDDPATAGGIRVMDFAINEAGTKLFAATSHSGFHPYTINSDGSLTSDISGGGGDDNKLGLNFTLWGYTVQEIWLDESGATDYLYAVTDYPTRCLAKYDMTNPSAVSFEYAYTGSGDCNGMVFIGDSGSGNTFAITADDSTSELKIIRDTGSSFSLLDSADIVDFHSSPDIIFDGEDTVIVHRASSTGDTLDMVAYDVSDPSDITQVFSPDTTTYGRVYTTWPYSWAEYHEKLGGFFIMDWVINGSPTYLYFIPRPETRNTGTGYDYKRTIELGLTDKVAGGPHTDFPVLIWETLDSLKTVTNGGKIKHDYGYDIIFTSDPAGETILDFEIEKYSSSTGEFIAWVDIPSLSSNTNIYMFYGNDNIVTSQERVLDTWNSNYKFVSHMNDRHDLYSGIKDSTTFQNNLPSSNDASSTSEGKVGDAFIYDGDVDYNYGTYSSDFDFTDEFTWSTWVKHDGLSGGTQGIVAVTGSRFYSGDANPTWLRMQIWDDLSVKYSMDYIYNYFYQGEWTKVDIVLDRPDLIYYRNGQEFATQTFDYDLLNDTTGSIITGTIQTNGYYLEGSLDEVRILNASSTADWIKTDYNTQNATSTFYSIGSESQASGYNTPGTLYSSILDIRSTDKELRSITVEQNIPSGCSLQITAEVSDDKTFPVASITSEVYSDTSSSYYTSSTSATLNGKKYLRYKVDATACNSNADTPTLYGAKFNYR